MSGTIVVRCPTDLHVVLVDEAKRQGVSLNNLCVSLLAGGIGFKPDLSRRIKAKDQKILELEAVIRDLREMTA